MWGLLKSILFRFPAEPVHEMTVHGLGMVGATPLRHLLAKYLRVQDPVLRTEVFGRSFENPFGLTAGMDKQAHAVRGWEALGFGYMEIGSVTAQPQPGNPGERLWRLPEDQSIVVHLGLNSIGAEAMARKLAKLRTSWQGPLQVGISLAKTKIIPSEQAPEDYLASFRLLKPYADFVVINLSCPNVEGFTNLQSPEIVPAILRAIDAENEGPDRVPVLVKLGPDLEPDALDTLVDAMLAAPLDGIIATNLRKKSRPELKSAHRDKPGGISGMPLQAMADDTLARIARRTRGRIALIGVGGVFTAEDAYRKIRLGASLVSLATGFIFGGPLTIHRLNRDLAALLKRDGFANVSEAVGVDLDHV